MATPRQLAMAKRMINASICAYQVYATGWLPERDPPPVLRTVDNTNGRDYYDVLAGYQDAVGFLDTAAHYTPLFVSSGDDSINAALVGATRDGLLVIALRGTLPPNFDHDDTRAWIMDWAQDGEIQPKGWTLGTGATARTFQVEGGFADAVDSLAPSLKLMIDQTLATAHCKGVVVTGHSKGGALTFLTAAWVEVTYPQFLGKIEVHAFAAPAVADAAFAAYYAASPLANMTHRYQVENDIVPFLPLWKGADIFAAVKFADFGRRIFWGGLGQVVATETNGGYVVVGDFTYFDHTHHIVAGAEVTHTALPAVAATYSLGTEAAVQLVIDAHSSYASYLPCF